MPRPFVVPEGGSAAPRAEAPGFSVVIPAYQAAATVCDAVASALAQTVRPLEVIVCDDGSTDEIESALSQFRHGITLIRQSHGGVSAARNAAVEVARGEFVSVLDADDVYEPERIEALTELARLRPDLDVVATDAFLEMDGRVVGRFNEENQFAVRDQRGAILKRCFCAWPAIRRSRLLDIGGFDTTLTAGEDWDCMIRLILGGASVGLVAEPLYRYRVAPGSLTGNRPEALRARVLVLEKAKTNPHLAPHERRVLHGSLALHRRRALVAEAEAALRSRATDARRRALAVVVTRGVGSATRLKAAAAALAPELARRRLEAGGRRARTADVPQDVRAP